MELVAQEVTAKITGNFSVCIVIERKISLFKGEDTLQCRNEGKN